MTLSADQDMVAVFQIIYKGRGSLRNFEGTIDVDLFKSSQVDHLFCWVFDLRPLSYLEHWVG